MSLSAYRHLLRALCWLACGAQDRRAEIEQDEANVGLLWATSEHQRQRSGSGYAAQPTAGPNAAATSADTDENGRVCVGDLGPYALLLRETPEHQRLTALRQSHTPHASHTRRS